MTSNKYWGKNKNNFRFIRIAPTGRVSYSQRLTVVARYRRGQWSCCQLLLLMLSSLLILLLLLLQQLHFPHRCIMDLRKFPLDSQVGSPHQKLLTITGFDYFNSKIKVFHKHNFRFKRIYPSQRHFTPPLKRITRIFPIFLENTSSIHQIFKTQDLFRNVVIFGKYELYFPSFGKYEVLFPNYPKFGEYNIKHVLARS